MMKNNILFHNCKILIFDEINNNYDSLLIENNIIKKIGYYENLKLSIDENTKLIDLNKKMIIPGFIDAHVHFYEYSKTVNQIDLSNCYSIEEIENAAKMYFNTFSPLTSELIKCFGFNKSYFDENKININFLDKLFPKNPVIIVSKDYHTYICNSVSLKNANITKETKNPNGGLIGKFDNGELNGYLFEKAWDLLFQSIKEPTIEEQIKLMENGFKKAVEFGIIGIHEMAFNEETYYLYDELLKQNKLKLRVTRYFPNSLLDKFINENIKSYSGNEQLKVGGLKLFADGSLGSKSAYMFDKYDNGNYGFLTTDENVLCETIKKANKNDICVAIHAIGNKTINILLNIFENIDFLKPINRIEHLQAIVFSDIIKITNNNIFCSMQPVHLNSDIPLIEKYWNNVQKQAYCFNTLLNNNVNLCFGSDSPVESINPFYGIYCAVTRKPYNNSNNLNSFNESEKITVLQAIKSYTINNAKLSKSEQIRGEIKEGFFADLIVIDDFTSYDENFWLTAKVYYTVIDGEIVFERE